MQIVASVDGSSLSNPGPAGWCWYIDDNNWQAGGWEQATNNQAELMAVLELLRATKNFNFELEIICDSQYVINSITKWMHAWKAKNWRKADGSAVLNQELMKSIDEEIINRKIKFTWVKGHAGNYLNEAADTRARAVALAYQTMKKPELGPGLKLAKVESMRKNNYSNSNTLFDFETDYKNTFEILLDNYQAKKLQQLSAKNKVSAEKYLLNILTNHLDNN